MIFFLAFANAQEVDQVSVGASYTLQTYYDISTGDVYEVENDAWDIAFSNMGVQDAGVFINESASLTGTSIKLFLTDINEWNEEIIDTSPFVDSLAIYNPEQNWEEGALNTVKDPDSAFDYGWGAYSVSSHTVVGDKIWVIKKRDGSFLKLQIQELASSVYSFRYADLDGNNEVTYSISKADYDSGQLIYFSFETQEEFTIPIDYDLIFQRYTTPLDAGDGTFLEYTVTGILLAPNTQAVVADGVDIYDVEEEDYVDAYSDLPTTIGHEWKAFDFTSGWIIDEDRVQFVRTSDNEIYKVLFYDFEGSSTGITTLEKTYLGVVSSSSDLQMSEITIYPNPSSNYIILQSDDFTPIDIITSNGQKISNEPLKDHQRISISTLNSGQYFLRGHENGLIKVIPFVKF